MIAGIVAGAPVLPSAPIPSTDPHFSSVVLLVGFNGDDGSTIFTDESNSSHELVANGDAQVDTSDVKYGTGSGLFDGTGDFIQCPISADMGFATEDFTIEGWFKRSGIGTDQGMYARGVLGGPFSQSSLSHAIFFGSDNKLNLRIYTGSTNITITTASAIIDTALWHHFALCQTGGTLYAFVDGVSVGTQSGYTSQNDDFDDWRSVIGSFGSVWLLPFNGRLDELRVTKGVARYTANFTPPTEAFPRS